MRAPLSWLRDFAPISGSATELASVLSDLGLVVEGMVRLGEGLGDVVVGEVLGIRSHPKADRVQLVDVNSGSESPIQVVCGAFNFETGDKVALAPVGASLPGGMEIARRKVRGEWSDGMLCSAAELGLSEDHAGIMVLPSCSEPGAGLVETLGIEADVVFDLDVSPNRPDALCMAGVARDLAARLRVPFKIPEPPAVEGRGDNPATVEVRIDAAGMCPRFTITAIDHVTVDESPSWLARRLSLAGMRPINNVVDVSNAVMLELGQPNHPYDLDRLGGCGLRVRAGRPGETVTTLDDIEREVGPDDCLICDASDAPVGLGGIMGGSSSEISESTSRIVLEAAWFSPMTIARTSKRLGLRTEASVRFERGVDPEGVERAVARYCQLLGTMARAATPRPTLEEGNPLPGRPRIRLRPERVNAILGTELSSAEVSSHLVPLGFGLSEDGDALQVETPPWRPDCEREIDLIEEIARHHGYTKITRTVPATARLGRLTPYQRDRRLIREVLVGAGVSEAWTDTFVSPEALERAGLNTGGAVAVSNPLAVEASVLRTSLLPGLMAALAFNASHRNADVSLFEVGHVFAAPDGDGDLPRERELAAVALAGRGATEAKRVWNTLAGVLRLEGISFDSADVTGLHPTRTLVVTCGDVALATVGEVDPDVVTTHGLSGPVGWLEFDLDPLISAPRRPAAARPVTRFPSADVDLAFVVDDAAPASAVEDALRGGGGELLDVVRLFDVFRSTQLGEGRRGLAYRLRFSSLEHTLSEDELAEARQRCISQVESTLPATLRS